LTAANTAFVSGMATTDCILNMQTGCVSLDLSHISFWESQTASRTLMQYRIPDQPLHLNTCCRPNRYFQLFDRTERFISQT